MLVHDIEGPRPGKCAVCLAKARVYTFVRFEEPDESPWAREPQGPLRDPEEYDACASCAVDAMLDGIDPR